MDGKLDPEKIMSPAGILTSFECAPLTENRVKKIWNRAWFVEPKISSERHDTLKPQGEPGITVLEGDVFPVPLVPELSLVLNRETAPGSVFPMMIFPFASAETLWQKSRMISIDTAAARSFEEMLGQSLIVIRDCESSFFLKVHRVRTLGHKRPGVARDPFAVEFLGPSGLRLEQGIYGFEHPAAGGFQIFITQVGDGPEGSLFEAVFT